MMTNESALQMFREYVEKTWNEGNMHVVDQFLSPSYTYHCGARPLVKTREDMKELIMGMRDANPNLRVTIDAAVANGDVAACRWTWQGTQEKEFNGIPATHRHVVVEGVSFYRMENGQVAECWEGYDMLGALQQMEIVVAPKAQQSLHGASLQ